MHVSSTHTHTHTASFAHEIDLLDVLTQDLNTNDFPRFLSPHSICLSLRRLRVFLWLLSTENLTVK